MTTRRTMNSCTPDIFQGVLDAISEGIPMIHHVEEQQKLGDYPTVETIRKYAMADNARFASYTRARELGADAMAEQTLVIADTDNNPQKASNRIKARQWYASKLKPKVYGDKLDIDIKGTIDVQAAILAARRRTQGIDNQQLIDVTTTDKISDVVIDHEPVIDPFS